jgi:hypothetical protein
MELTLAKALNEKNRLVKKISKLKDDIRNYNVRLSGAEQEVDVECSWKELLESVDLLVDLKSEIMACNMNAPDFSDGIQKDIFRLSELKALVNFLKSLDTKHGLSNSGSWGRGETQEYVAIFRKSEVDEKVEAFEKEINDLQHTINQYNYETTMVFDFKGLI